MLLLIKYVNKIMFTVTGTFCLIRYGLSFFNNLRRIMYEKINQQVLIKLFPMRKETYIQLRLA